MFDHLSQMEITYNGSVDNLFKILAIYNNIKIFSFLFYLIFLIKYLIKYIICNLLSMFYTTNTNFNSFILNFIHPIRYWVLFHMGNGKMQ